MKIAIPTNEKTLSLHFGHCKEFAIIEADQQSKTVTNIEYMDPPQHEPGVLPRWLSEMKADLVIAGGMGMRAQQLFEAAGVKVIVGAQEADPKKLVEDFLNDKLECGKNVCDH